MSVRTQRRSRSHIELCFVVFCFFFFNTPPTWIGFLFLWLCFLNFANAHMRLTHTLQSFFSFFGGGREGRWRGLLLLFVLLCSEFNFSPASAVRASTKGLHAVWLIAFQMQPTVLIMRRQRPLFLLSVLWPTSASDMKTLRQCRAAVMWLQKRPAGPTIEHSETI